MVRAIGGLIIALLATISKAGIICTFSLLSHSIFLIDVFSISHLNF